MSAMDGLSLPMSGVSFRDVVLLFPLAVAAHVMEEWPRFPRWARRVASPRYSDREYVVTHALALITASGGGLALHRYSATWAVFVFFALLFGPGVVGNALFHVGASFWTRTYCPGAVTGVVVYVPLGVVLAWTAIGEGLISPELFAFAMSLAIAFHTAEVGHNVFKRW